MALHPRRRKAAAAAALAACLLAGTASVPSAADGAANGPAGPLGSVGSGNRTLAEKYRSANTLKPIAFDTYTEDQLPAYPQALQKLEAAGARPTSGLRIELPAVSYSAFGASAAPASAPPGAPAEAGTASGPPERKSGIGGRNEPALLWGDGTDWIEWTFDVPQTGLYELELTYYAVGGTRAPIERSVRIDGTYPFNEAQRLILPRFWTDAGEPTVNDQGDDVRPKQVEAARWETVRMGDGGGKYAEPLRFPFAQGKRTVRLTKLREPVALASVALVSPEPIPSYAEARKRYEAAAGGAPTAKTAIKVQAENAAYKTDPALRRESNSDPLVEPKADGYQRLNVMGGWRWRKGGQQIGWTFEVPETGLYRIGLKAGQWWGDGLPVYRKIEIDGKVPFRELEQYRFSYDRDWRMDVLGGPGGHDDPAGPGGPGKPDDGAYWFHLTEGTHTIRMTVQTGPYSDIIESMNGSIRGIADLIRRIQMVTGSTPDPNYRYELEKRIPNLLADLNRIEGELGEQMEKLRALTGRTPAIVNSLAGLKDQFRDMAANPDRIPGQLEELAAGQTKLGNWLLGLGDSPLVLDYFWIAPAGAKKPKVESNALQRGAVMLKNFWRSFTKNYDRIGDAPDGTERASIDVWVGNGREWAQLVKELADESFTPETGIGVNVNTIPAGQLGVGHVNTLLLALSSGQAPDVAVGVDGTLPAEFAFRDAVVDLNRFADYRETASRFLPGALIPFRYDGGDYALPETQDFNVLFYRKDLLAELGLGIPDTWDDLLSMLPALQRNGMDAYVPASFDPFLYQQGGSYYSPDGAESGLSSPEAYQAFKKWTDLYTNYGIPIQADFFSRMRADKMPIGLAGYQHYVQLATAAPELAGRWAIAPAPGTKRPDGTIDRTAGGALKAALIFKQSERQEESWQFLKWWMSKDTQVQFGQELESLLGVEARWNTANVEAFRELPWRKEDLAAFEEMWRWFREQPVVLGGYFTGRHLNNAWNRVVLSGQNPRESLEDAVKEIDKELKLKREEYGEADAGTKPGERAGPGSGRKEGG
ncbi:extracellular solute-binding protein [Paenibacillus flagellatus]|uniref:ABC transporter substrate-binding protein n=1 Tax=Paenibacillus flagellatus TaxID=2211139 RepID=A0A2V5KCX6_9BACL|nr:extracellular solute-binding protein [Paenibacillus flagellatus]PYI57495.1 ABC transporter substrate-binding protein [Paenibacillus flagellatus]